MVMGKSLLSFNRNVPPPTLNVWPPPKKKVLTRFIEFFGGVTEKDETKKQIRRDDAGRGK